MNMYFYLEGDERINHGEMKSFLFKFLSASGDEYREKFLKSISNSEEGNEVDNEAI